MYDAVKYSAGPPGRRMTANQKSEGRVWGVELRLHWTAANKSQRIAGVQWSGGGVDRRGAEVRGTGNRCSVNGIGKQDEKKRETACQSVCDSGSR